MLFIATLLITPAFSFAQSDGSLPSDQKPADAPSTTTAPTTPTEPIPADSTGGTQVDSSTSAPATTDVRPVTTPAADPRPAATSPGTAPAADPASLNVGTAIAEAQVEGSSSGNALLWIIIGVAVFGLAFMPFGFLLSGRLKKKEISDDTDNRCFDIKQMMEEKLRELTDVKAMVRERAIEKGKEVVRDAVSGTATGDILVRAQKLEEQYNKLKALYEECQIDIDRYQYKGVLVENSLVDTEILKRVKIIRSYEEGDWKLHDIRLSKKQIADIQQSIADAGWYFHLWEPGKDRITVVFKDKLFEIAHSDRTSWNDAIAHGIAKGIPPEQLDFRVS